MAQPSELDRRSTWDPASLRRRLGRAPWFIGVVEDRARVGDHGAAQALRNLGADVRTIGLRDPMLELLEDDDDLLGIRARAVLFEALERPDLAVAALGRLRQLEAFDGVGALLAVSDRQVARIDPAAGFADFVVYPYLPAELYARIRAIEWRFSEFQTDERQKVGAIVLDKAARDVAVDGRPIALTAKEFALLAFLVERRGRVLSRDRILSGVWGTSYAGGARTVDIHVRRLRAKLADALPLATVRGVGYTLSVVEPSSSPGSSRRSRTAQAL